MLSFIFRRILSAAPALLAFAIALFALVAAAPPPVGLSEEELARRFVHLPLLLNVDPQDRPRIVARVVAGIPDAGEARRRHDIDRLLRIGAAGLPDLVPALDRLSVGDRARIARDLAPLAFRMLLDDVADLDVPARAERFWRRVLEERGPEIRPANVRRALRRHLAERNEPLYTRQIRGADTAALEPLIDTLDTPLSAVDHEEVELLAIEAARHAGATRVHDAPSLREWWVVHHAEYVEFEPLTRIAARITETRFGRWVVHAVLHRFGQSWRTDAPVLDDLRARAPTTLGRVLLAILLAYAVALPLAWVGAARRGGPGDRSARWALLIFYAFPPAVLALVLRSATPRAVGGTVVLVITLSMGVAPVIARQARSTLLEVARLPFVPAARARGIEGALLWWSQIARNAVGPVVALAALQMPIVLGVALIVEEVLGVDGLGPATMEALRARDVPWLMALALFVAVGATLLLLIGDLVHASFDPRVRHSMAADARER